MKHMRVPFSDTYVAQPKGNGSLSCRAERGIFVGYPEHTRDGVWRSYMHGSRCVQTSRHMVFDEYKHFGAEDTLEQKAKRTSALAADVAALEQRSSALPKRDTASSTVIRAAASETSYFVANAGVLDKTSPYIHRSGAPVSTAS